MLRSIPPALVAALVLSAAPVEALPVVIDFETLADGDVVLDQFTGISFTNTAAVAAGISLNEFEFPPLSGTNVVFDAGGPLSIAFSDPVSSFSAYFTYVVPLTMTAYDAAGNLLGQVASAFGSNLALSGEAGSAPNELLQLSAGGIASITIAGDVFGGSFVLDNLTYDRPEGVPEPSTLALLGVGLAAITFRRCRQASTRR